MSDQKMPNAVIVRMNSLTDPLLVEETGQIRHAVYEWSEYEEEYTFVCWTLDVWSARKIADLLNAQDADRG